MEDILRFKFPKDAVEFKIASGAMRLFLALHEIDEVARQALKGNADADTTLEEIRHTIAESHLLE